ncbi:MAG TPA: hypothetical protein VM261_34045 [Kofleriaceae bacterium]|nr:hypothetical protein [Kofleriaceae bacterium]
MNRNALAALLLCTASVAAADPAPAGPVTAPDGRTFALVNLRQRFDECSGAGGEHYVFDVEVAAGSPTMKAHTGGHAIYLGLLGHRALAPAAASADRWYVAELVIAKRLSEDRDGNPDSSVSGWCLDGIPPTQASVQRLITVADHDAGLKVLAAIGATGLPRAYATVGSVKRPGPETLAIVRVVERIDRDANAFRVETVEGSAPAVVDFATLPVWTGDLVVVAVTTPGGSAVARTRGTPTVTRALVADDLAEAKRWKTAVAAGWPPEAQVTGWSGSYAVARWSAAGKVKRGTRRCGAEVELSTWSGSSFQIDPVRVAAPAGTRAKDVVTGVVVPQPADRCGRVARFVRVYQTPGATRADWIVAGEPAPSAAIVE